MLRSIINNVKHPPSTGIVMINKNLVTLMDHENTDIKYMDKFLFFIIIIVTIKFKLLNNLLTPLKCNLKTIISIDYELCPNKLLNGGYIVQLVPLPPSIIIELININYLKGNI